MPATTQPENSPTEADNATESLEQPMAELGLSSESKRFLRKFRLVEKQLNAAREQARSGGDLGQCVSELYRDMYRVP